MDKKHKKIQLMLEKLLSSEDRNFVLKTVLELLSSEDQNFVLKTVLEHLKWPVGLETGIEYFVNEDDTDGARRGIGVSFLDNGDGVLDLKECKIESHFAESEVPSIPHVYRFRNYFGGGRSLYVHRALLVLAQAVILDKDEEVTMSSIGNEK